MTSQVDFFTMDVKITFFSENDQEHLAAALLNMKGTSLLLVSFIDPDLHRVPTDMPLVEESRLGGCHGGM
jgi:hypothetical protein